MIDFFLVFAQNIEAVITSTHNIWFRGKMNIPVNNNEKFRSLKSKENIHKKKVGPYRGFGYKSLISDPINLAKGAREKYCKFANFNMSVV